jgi:nucleolar GTP-binding protein
MEEKIILLTETSQLNPFENINPTPNKEILIDKAFKKAAKYKYQTIKKISKFELTKKDSKDKITIFSQILIDSLYSIVERFPSIDKIEPFYFSLLDVLFSIDKIKIALSSINGTVATIKTINREAMLKIKKSKNITEIIKFRKSVYGRSVSVINRIEENLQFIRDVIFEMRKIPSIDTSLITIAVAGHPNIGKSTFVKTISSAKPEIADYPFTTKKISIGHWIYSNETIQIIDTPGLLDRPINEKNKIELQAIIVLRHIADAIIFMFDASGTCGYPLDNQLKLFFQMKKLFSDNIILPILNKADISENEKMIYVKNKIGDLPEISSNNRDQVEEIVKIVIKKIKDKI